MPKRHFYFFALMNNAKNHPIMDQPNIHDPIRTRILSYFERSFANARYNGVNTIHTKTAIAAIYLRICKKPFKVIIYIPYFAFVPNSSAIRINWLYFAMRSVRDIEPVFI